MRRGFCLAFGLALILSAPALAEYDSMGFEGLNGSPDGVPLTDQDGFYIPPGTDSVDWLVMTYSGNAFGVPQNPGGGDLFVAGLGPASPTFARAQRDITIPPGGVWTAEYEFVCFFLDAPPSANNIGSFSMRSSDTANDFIHLFSWVDPNTADAFNAFYLAYDAAGNQFAQPGASPGPAWENLELWHWYRAWTTFDLDQNLILEVGIVDLATGTESVFQPTDWYLEGGAGGGVGEPISFRFFAGGTVFGNGTGFDNVWILPYEPVVTEATSWGRMKAGYR